MTRFCVLLTLLLCVGVTQADIGDLFEEFWRWRMKISPEFASWIGYKGSDRELNSYDPRVFQQHFAEATSLLKKAETMSDDVDDKNKLYYKMMLYQLQIYTEGYHYVSFINPVDKLEGIQIKFYELMKHLELKTEENFEDLLIRFYQLPVQIDEIIELMREAARVGKPNNRDSMLPVLEAMDHLFKPYQESVFYAPFKEIPSTIPSDRITQLQESARVEIIQRVFPAFRKLDTFIRGEYMNVTRKEAGVWSLPDGLHYYQQCLKFHTSTDLTADEIHEMGKSEVSRIEEDMKKVIEELGLNKTIKQFSADIRNDERHFAKSPADMYNFTKDLVFRRISSKLHLVLSEKHRGSPMEIVETPAALSGIAFYRVPVPSLGIPGRYYINTLNYKKQPLYELLSLSLHEAEPGHHTQFSSALKISGVPEFVKNPEYFKVNEVPFHFPFGMAFSEGWGLYSERLGFEMGLYDDLYERFGHYIFAMLRACRLVVDTGMHAFRWTRQEAIDYMLEHMSAFSKSLIESEVDRYIAQPGQSCSYKVGELKIMELRKKTQETLKDKFNLLDFHDAILSCPAPLFILGDCIDDYIKEKQKREK